MPFTISHAAAAIPFARTGLVVPALIIGTMAPDFHYFLPLMPDFVRAHSVVGVVTVDLLRGLMVFAVWAWFVARPAADLAPEWIHRRLRPGAADSARPRRVRDWLLVCVSIVIGAATHVLWDSFTHAGRWGVETFPFLTEEIAGRSGYRWLQWFSSAVGILLLIGWLAWWASHTKPRRHPREVVDSDWRQNAWLSLVLIAATAGLAGWLLALSQNNEPFSAPAGYAAAVFCMGATALTTLIICLLWFRKRG